MERTQDPKIENLGFELFPLGITIILLNLSKIVLFKNPTIFPDEKKDDMDRNLYKFTVWTLENGCFGFFFGFILGLKWIAQLNSKHWLRFINPLFSKCFEIHT